LITQYRIDLNQYFIIIHFMAFLFLEKPINFHSFFLVEA
jgi:hypothetical protein